MTREKAIERVSRWLDKGKQHEDNQLGYIEGWFTKEDEQAFLMAINALQTETCEDAISRQAAIEQSIVLRDISNPDKEWEVVTVATIKHLKSVQPEQNIVRCKDCGHRDPEDKKCDCGCWHFPFITKDDDFCSYGERR